MSDLFAAPVAPFTPRRAAPKRAEMPARFLWPGDTLIINGQGHVLTRIECDGLQVTVRAGAETFGPMPLNDTVDVILREPGT